MIQKPKILAGSCALLLGLSACAEQSSQTSFVDDLKTQVSELEAQVGEKDKEIADRDRMLKEISSQKKSTPVGSGAELLPANAKAGECYARVYVPPRYRDKTESVVTRQESESIKVLPAVYKPVEKKVLVKAESQRLEVIPARYDWVEEKILVQPETERLVSVPAKYENVTERILVRPAYTTWKKGRGPIEKIDQATGEIMCLVEVPAEYRTVVKRVLKSPATTRKVMTPAVYKTVKKRVMVEGPKTRTVTVPAEYRTQTVQELVRAAKEKRTKIPATYQKVTKREKVSDGRVEWRSILCETNTTAGVVSRLQAALLRAGHNPGRQDGVLGSKTMAAVNSYQRAKRLPTGPLTIETLRSLGVSL